jgi:hypothetical protein
MAFGKAKSEADTLDQHQSLFIAKLTQSDGP